MRRRLALLTALIALFAQSVVTASVALPTLDATDEAITVSSGEQRLTVRLADASLRFESPCGAGDMTATIDSPTGLVHPSRAEATPKLYRGSDCVAALITFSVSNDRKLTLHVDAYPGIEAVFVKSSLTGLCAGAPDCYSWSWSEGIDLRAASSDWIFLPGSAGGIAVLTSGTVSCASGKPLVNALPKSRFLRPGETLDIGFGLAAVKDADAASVLSKAARAKAVRALKQPEQVKIDYGKPAPAWLREAELIQRGSDARTAGSLLIVDGPASQSVIQNAHDAGMKVIVSANLTELPISDADAHPNWVCVDADGNPAGSLRTKDGLACFHLLDLRDAALARVCDIMNIGADGVLLDRATPSPECHGPKFEKHTHPDPDKTNNDMFEELAREIYALVKTFGQDKVVIQNSGILPARWSYCDAQAREMAGDWPEPRYAAEEHAGAVRAGKVPVMTLDAKAASADRRAESVLYAYSYTRLNGWLMTDLASDSTGLAQAIRATRLGKPLGDTKRASDALYRVFERGVVVLNPTDAAATVSIPLPLSGKLTDIAHDREVSSIDGKLVLQMSPRSGRALLRRD